MKYISTRNTSTEHNFEDTLLLGMSPGDGGLFLPKTFPSVDAHKLGKFEGMHYAHVAALIMKLFCGEEIPSEKLAQIVHSTYNQDVFDHADIAPLVQISDDLWILELFHGPTLAFKDYALQLLGRLFDYVLEKKDASITIIGATSGDTGSAAIEACKDRENIKVFIMHPKGRTSEVQRKQMTTVYADNIRNLAITGTFDDCQALVKNMFADDAFRESVNLSAINSINWARICAQISYYIYAAIKVGGGNTPVNFAVPTGNFGNVFAAHCARRMNFPIKDLVIGTNTNDIITRFFETGEMSKETVSHTISPSMDIQVSSNFERYLFELVGENPQTLSQLMKEFADTGHMRVSSTLLQKAQKDFKAYTCDDETTLKTIKDIYDETGYLLDPHSAIGVHAARKAKATGTISGPTIALACAHPSKFPDAIEKAIGTPPEMPEKLQKVMKMAEFMTSMPNDLQTIQTFVKGNI